MVRRFFWLRNFIITVNNLYVSIFQMPAFFGFASALPVSSLDYLFTLRWELKSMDPHTVCFDRWCVNIGMVTIYAFNLDIFAGRLNPLGFRRCHHSISFIISFIYGSARARRSAQRRSRSRRVERFWSAHYKSHIP